MIYRQAPAGCWMPQFLLCLPSTCQRRLPLICPGASDLPCTYRARTLTRCGRDGLRYFEINKQANELAGLKSECASCGEAEVTVKVRMPGPKPLSLCGSSLCAPQKPVIPPCARVPSAVGVRAAEDALTSAHQVCCFDRCLNRGLERG